MFAKSMIALAGAAASLATVNAQVTATGTMGTTNPPAATMGTAINQTSYARLISLNAIDDFCLFAPPTPGVTIGDSEAYEVAWCVQPRNDARVIPDGVFQGVHMVRTPMYVQIQGWGDFTKLNIQEGDSGGELDPHGATGDGNPVGGNVTSNITGSDVSYQEWMSYMSYDQFCLRICTAETSSVSAALQCQHTLDEMGCQWVMPGDYTNGTFTDCMADAAIPPGLYPQPDGSTSTFAQRYTNSASVGGTWTVGDTVTPQTPASTPASSMCTTYTSIGNGIQSLAVAGAASASAVTAAASSPSMSGSAAMTGMSSGSAASSMATGGILSSAKSAAGSAVTSAGSAATSAAGSVKASAGGAMGLSAMGSNGMSSTFVAGFSAFALVAGAGALFL